jgi:hypothetical protein
MATRKSIALQQYPRRQGDGYLADEILFPRPDAPLTESQLESSVKRAFERCLKNKSGEKKKQPQTPSELVKLCIQHLRERSDPVLSPSFLSLCRVEEIFELDAVAHEMQRQRMQIGIFYQYLIIELMKHRFPSTVDGKKEGDVEAEIDTPGFSKGLRLFMSVKKSADTVGGQDVAGMIRRLEMLATEDKNLTRPYVCVVCVATPPRGKILSYSESRQIKRNSEGHPYSPNCEVWLPGFIFPFISGLSATAIYRAALAGVAEFLPFHALSQRRECAELLSSELKKLGLVNNATGKIDPIKFQDFVSQPPTDKAGKKK